MTCVSDVELEQVSLRVKYACPNSGDGMKVVRDLAAAAFYFLRAQAFRCVSFMSGILMIQNEEGASRSHKSLDSCRRVGSL